MDHSPAPAQGLMMDAQLTIPSLIRHAAQWHGATPIVSRMPDRSLHRSSYGEVHSRARRLARCLVASGVARGERIGTLGWNSHRHMELYFAVSGIGAVCHTINPRLFAEQIIYIVNHAGDSQLYFDPGFLPLVREIAPHCPAVKRWILMGDAADMPQPRGKGGIFSPLCYEEELAASTEDFAWPDIDERLASSLCYTSGTTGNPKGVLYSHRSTILHALTMALPDAMRLSARDVAMPVVPMFHVNAWGMPYCGAAIGTKLVLPGPHLDPASLYELLEAERVTFAAGVPTIWNAMLQHLEQHNLRFTTLRRVLVGGSALPESTIRAYREKFGVDLVHAWGMTEVSPLGTTSEPLGKHTSLPQEAVYALLAKQGRVPYGVDIKIVGDDGARLPHDGKAFGRLMVRGPWVASAYYKGENGKAFADGWFDTGDVATIDADGFMQITDRAKDVIKSGGEWISSITLESLAMAHPAVAEAAVVAVPHPKWDERPLLLVVRRPAAQVEADEILKFLEGKVARWWMPDAVEFVDSLPHTATGKILKTTLRAEYANYSIAAPAAEAIR